MLNTSFPNWPSFSEEEADAVKAVVLSGKVNYWTGEETRKFEAEFADFVDAKHAIATSNGTTALDMAINALNIGPGDEVIVTPRTFIASISSVVMAGATPIFADVDLDTQNLTAESISDVLTSKTKAIVVVHLAGMPAEMDPIMSLAEERGVFVIEDCAQAHGAKYKGRSVGTIGHIGAWSFCQDKIMTTGGEGGMVTTNDQSLWSAMWSFKDHGKSWDAIYNKSHPPGFRWLHESFGTNCRMTEMQAAIGRIQIKRMAGWQEARLNNAQKIWNATKTISWLRVPEVSSEFTHAAYKAYVFVRPESLPLRWSRDDVLEALQKEGIPAFSGSCSEVYLEKAFDQSGFRPEKRLPAAKELGETSLMFLVHPTLEEIHIEKTINALLAVDKRIQEYIAAEQLKVASVLKVKVEERVFLNRDLSSKGSSAKAVSN